MEAQLESTTAIREIPTASLLAAIFAAALLQCSAPAAGEDQPTVEPTVASPLAEPNAAEEQIDSQGDGLPQFGDLLVVPPVGAYGRTPLHVDPVHAALARGQWEHPAAGDALLSASGQRVIWETLAPDAAGVWSSPALAGGYAAATLQCDAPRIALLEATGHAMAYVNGEPRAGDPYATGRMVCPVALTPGTNEFLFHVAAGELHARLIRPPQALFFDLRDAAFPDLLAGDSGPVFAALLLVNASEKTITGAELTSFRAGAQSITAAVPAVPPLGVLRLVVPIDGSLTESETAAGSVRVQVDLTLPSGDGQERPLADSKAFDLAVVRPTAPHVRTYLSSIDGGVQPYAVLPAASSGARATTDADSTTASSATLSAGPHPGVVVALHPAGTTPQQMLAGVAPLADAHIIAPQGRRPFGFDWEDWSRADALEALADFRQRTTVDSQRTWICGEGDGGHGALRLAALYPDQFAATASVDGWLDYHAYGASIPAWENPTEIQRLLAACTNDQRLTPLLGNLAHAGVAVRCDAAAPMELIDQARRLRAALSEFHSDFAYRESLREELPGGSPALAPSVTSFLTEHELPPAASIDRVAFVTPDVGIAASCHWVKVLAPRDPGELCRANAMCDDLQRTIRLATENIAGIEIDLSRLSPGAPVTVAIDGELLPERPWPRGGRKALRFVRRGDAWEPIPGLPPEWKRPERFGGIRAVWNRRVALVYGTQGSEEENAWALAKARFDAEQFLVRAAGAALVVADVDFNDRGDPHRNVVLYGNAETNSQWRKLLSESPVQTRPGQVIVGGRPESGDDLACLFVRPRPGSPSALVAAIGGAGIVGMRATDRLPMFVSGVRLPDLLLFGADALQRGTSEIRATGWFGLDWGVDGGQFAWREAAL